MCGKVLLFSNYVQSTGGFSGSYICLSVCLSVCLPVRLLLLRRHRSAGLALARHAASRFLVASGASGASLSLLERLHRRSWASKLGLLTRPEGAQPRLAIARPSAGSPRHQLPYGLRH